MKDTRINVEVLEKLEAPHFLCFVAGLGTVACIVTLT